MFFEFVNYILFFFSFLQFFQKIKSLFFLRFWSFQKN